MICASLRQSNVPGKQENGLTGTIPLHEVEFGLNSDRYTADWDYGRTTVYFIMGFIILFGIFRLSSLFLMRPGKRDTVLDKSFSRRSLALYRYLAYRSYYLDGYDWYSPSYGVLLIGGIGFVFCTSKCLRRN